MTLVNLFGALALESTQKDLRKWETLNIDDSTEGITFIGQKNGETFRIKKITETAGLTTIRFATFADDFDTNWTNRAGLTYTE